MPTTFFYINTAALDSYGDVWAVGRDLTKYDGENWSYYNYQNSVVPSNSPYFLDTRSISIDNENTKWVGCAVTASLSQDLVFAAKGSQAATGESWNLSQFGSYASQSPNWEVPTIYASPYTEEVLAFISPLNGGAGTGGTGNTGVTGGYLWRYDKSSEQWSEVSPGYTWPHIYEITAKGEGGNYFEYYLSTNDGLQTIPQGNLDPITLDNGDLVIKQMSKYNSLTSGIGGNTVYSVSFDENGNYWAGTENGITYWDGKKFYNWNVGGADGVTKVVARKNGHVFFRIGNPFDQPSTSDGFYHFNGDTFTHLTSSNTNLPDDRVIQLMKVEEKSLAGTTTIYEDDLWIVAGNNICLFDYSLPHIYGTSKYTGTTGWNFVYYTHTTEGGTTDTARLPKADKYTWKYPTWRGYDNEYLKNLHPGLDPRNLFLETNFKDVADGSAGRQPYWNDGEVVPFSESESNKLIPDSEWLTDTTPFNVTSVNKYKEYNVVTGYSEQSSIDFGERNNLTPNYTISNPNPTESAGGTADLGFVALYSDGGQIKTVIPFRGFSTRVHKAVPSLDNSSIYVIGTFRKYIEAGEFIYSSKYPGASSMTVTGITGPTGGPVGFSNIGAPGLTGSSDYQWILNGPTGATSGIFLPQTSILGDTEAMFVAEIEVDLGNKVSYGDIDFSAGEIAKNQFALKNFRYFPGASGSFDPSGIINASLTPPTDISKLDLSISQNSVRITSNYLGGISTLKYNWFGLSDLPNSSEFIFSSASSGAYDRSGSVIDLNSNLSLRNGFTVGLTGGSTSSLDVITSLENSLTYVLSGTSTRDVNVRGLSMTHPNPGYSYPYFVLNDFNHSPITGAFVRNSGGTAASYTTWYDTVNSYKSDDQYYLNLLYTDSPSTSPTSTSLTGIGTSGGVNLLTVSIKPGGSYNMLSYSEILPETYGSPQLVSISDQSDALAGGDQYTAIYYQKTPGVTGSGHDIIKRNVSGTSIDTFSTFGTGNTGDQSQLRMHVRPQLDVFVSGSSAGVSGPSQLPYSSATGSFASLLESYKPGIGKDMGNIISRAGSGAWTWVDVHNSNSDLFVPLLSTVFLSNGGSEIYGKNSNRWKLTNALTGNVILDIKDVPFFIYTFSQSGYYSIQNIVEDCNGNVYEISKPAFVKVVDQTIPLPDDPNPEFVNSADYGYPRRAANQNGGEYRDLSKDLLEDQKNIMLQNVVPFGSSLIIRDNPDATYDQF
jgi:hypothetical protein